MDEPLAALDRFSKEEILPYLERLHSALAIPVLYVSHDISEVERLADHLVLLRDGQVEAAGPLGDLLTDPRLPLASEAATVLEGVVEGAEPGYGLLRLQLAGGQLLVPGRAAPGERLRLRVSAVAVNLNRRPPVDSSTLNALPCRVLSHQPDPPYRVTVLLRLGETGEGGQLLARVSHKAWDDLALRAGERVYGVIGGVDIVTRPSGKPAGEGGDRGREPGSTTVAGLC